MLGFGETTIVGSYVVDNESYRVVAAFEFGQFDFDIYSSTQITLSEQSESMVHCDRRSSGFIYSNYTFDEETKTIVCSLHNYKPVAGETIPETLTFNIVGSIAQNPDTRWYAQEIDMYLDSFSDVNGYFRGEIAIDGEKYYIHAFEIGNDNYFMLSIENGKINNLRSGTTSPLIRLCFEITGDQIIAKVSDEYITNKVAFPYWQYDDVIITFELLSL